MIILIYLILLGIFFYYFPNVLYIRDTTNGIPNYIILFMVVLLFSVGSYLGYFFFTQQKS
jgi:hypothetical protein